MEIGNQQGRVLKVDFDRLMLNGIDVSQEIRKGFTVDDTIKFIKNINQDYTYFYGEFDLTRDQTKRMKKKVFDQYSTTIPDGFRTIPMFPAYAVNEYGVVIYIRSRNILRSNLCKKGYPVVCLTDKTTVRIHRLVATTWIANPLDKQEVNHINGNKLMNFVSNLEWCTAQENLEHKRIHNLGKTRKAKISATGQNNSQAKLLPKDIYEIRSSIDSASHLASVYSVTQHTINDIKARRSWSHI